MMTTTKNRLYLRRAIVAGAIAAVALAAPVLWGCAGQPSTESPSDPMAAAQATESFDYSGGIDDRGLWEGLDALSLVDLCDYEAIEVPADVLPTDEDVQAAVDAFLANNAQDVQVLDRAIVDGDIVNIDYVGKIDGVEFSGGSTNGAGTYVTIGVTQYIDDFLQQLIGHKPGETFDIEVTFPDDYGATELAGKDAVFTVTINHIIESRTPELTDEWVASVGAVHGWTTVQDMRDAFRKELQDRAVADYVKQYVVDNSTVTGEVPQFLVDYQEGFLVNYFQEYANLYGVSLGEILSMYAGVDTPEALIEQNREMIDAAAERMLVYQAIVEDSGLTITEEEAREYLAENLGSTDLDGFIAMYGMPYLKFNALMQKVDDMIIANAVLPEGAVVAETPATEDATTGTATDAAAETGTDAAGTDTATTGTATSATGTTGTQAEDGTDAASTSDTATSTTDTATSTTGTQAEAGAAAETGADAAATTGTASDAATSTDTAAATGTAATTGTATGTAAGGSSTESAASTDATSDAQTAN